MLLNIDGFDSLWDLLHLASRVYATVQFLLGKLVINNHPNHVNYASKNG
jgi:hypothetical protein